MGGKNKIKKLILATGAAAAIGLVKAAGILTVADKISQKNN